MKQIIDLKAIWFNTKRALYATMVLSLVMALPVLSWIELSHEEEQNEKTIQVANISNQVKAANIAVFQKQS